MRLKERCILCIIIGRNVLRCYKDVSVIAQSIHMNDYQCRSKAAVLSLWQCLRTFASNGYLFIFKDINTQADQLLQFSATSCQQVVRKQELTYM